MTIATASLDFDRFNRPPKLSALTPELAALQSCPLFADASPSALQALVAAASLRSVARGTIVATEGSPAPAVVLVARGRLRAVRRAASGREITVEVFRPGDLLADAALTPQAPLANDWEAAESTTLLLISRETFLAHVRGAPEVTVALAAQLLSRLDRAKDLAVALALSDVESRVVAALVGLGRQDGADGPEGLLIRQRPTQQDIANQIGACRETVSRTVSDLVRRGLLTPRGRSLLLARSLYAGAA
jgi:CRP/FNR family transcriptional regulator, cyclic AMP receptor protein